VHNVYCTVVAESREGINVRVKMDGENGVTGDTVIALWEVVASPGAPMESTEYDDIMAAQEIMLRSGS
jgi:hypothetical protein